MSSEALQSGPIFVFNRWKRHAISGLVGGFIILGLSVFLLPTDGLNAKDYGAGFFVVLGGAFLGLAIYGALTEPTGEFYEDYLRIIPRRGEPVDLPYSQMFFSWEGTQGRGGGILGAFSIVTPDGKEKVLFRFSDVKNRQSGARLFDWIGVKCGKHISKETLMEGY